MKELAAQVTNTDDAEAAQICTTSEDLEVINAIKINKVYNDQTLLKCTTFVGT